MAVVVLAVTVIRGGRPGRLVVERQSRHVLQMRRVPPQVDRGARKTDMWPARSLTAPCARQVSAPPWCARSQARSADPLPVHTSVGTWIEPRTACAAVVEHARPVAHLHSRPGEHVVPHGKRVRCNRVDELGDGASERKSYLANPPTSTFVRAVAAV